MPDRVPDCVPHHVHYNVPHRVSRHVPHGVPHGVPDHMPPLAPCSVSQFCISLSGLNLWLNLHYILGLTVVVCAGRRDEYEKRLLKQLVKMEGCLTA